MRKKNPLTAALIGLVTLIFISQNLSAQKGEKSSSKDNVTVETLRNGQAESMAGLLTVHQLEEKYYLEIPDSILGRDIMAITRVAKTATGAGYGGELGNKQVFRFEKSIANKLFIRIVSYSNVSADTLSPIYQAVQNSNVHPIAAAFDILDEAGNSTLIEVSDFFLDPNQAFQLEVLTRQEYKLKKLEKDRSFLNYIRSYPENVEIRSTLTYSVDPPKLDPPAKKKPSKSKSLTAGLAAGVVTLEMNTSMILLPKVPMRRRFYDRRVGIFASKYTVFAEEGQRAETESFTVRWRLEAKNKADEKRQQDGELIEPKKPIVFYIDPATPEKWRTYLKQGVEDWQVAFEQAGWKNAILAKDWPKDESMSLEDSRYSVIRYFASNIQNAYGPNVHDPRSGEILESHIGWYHNVMKLLKNWYTIQAGAIDPEARPNEFDDDLMGRLVRFVCAHEVGHTIGLRHNFGASFATPVEKLRDKAYLEVNGHTSSIMDYARFNYVAQPEDGITDLFPRIGDYDKWAIEWNYKPIYDSKDEYEDKIILNNWYKSKAENNARLHYITQRNPYDPRAQSEDLGNNAVKASEYGIANLKRILPEVVNWTKKEAEDYERAAEFYQSIYRQYNRYIGHVTKWIGGIYESPKTTDQEGAVFTPVPKGRQVEAIDFLNRQVFTTPMWLLNAEIRNKISPDQGLGSLAQLQNNTLKRIFNPRRLERIIEAHAVDPNAYGLDELYSSIYKGIWNKAKAGQSMSTHERNLQKFHLERMITLLTPELGTAPRSLVKMPSTIDPSLTDIVSISRGTLKKMKADLLKSTKKYSDGLDKYHVEDCIARIRKALDEK